MHPGLALVGEIEITRRREDQIVDALEALACRRLQERRHGAARRVERHDPALVVGDEHAAVAVNLQPVRPSIILGHELPLALRANTENAAIRDVGDVQPALPIE